MSRYELLLTNNIDCDDVYNYANKVLLNKRALFLTATQNLKRIRVSSNKLNFVKDKDSILTFSELKEKIYENLSEGPKFLSRADQKFILNQVIKSLFKGERQLALYKIRNDIFELFEYLLEQEVSPISDEILNLIAKNFTNNEKDIFTIYNKYYDNLFEIKNGRTPKDIEIDRLCLGKQVKLLSEVYNSYLFKQVEDYDIVVFDGFLFFNEEQRKLLQDAIMKGKDLLFIAKTMQSDKTNFLLNDLFLPLEKEFDIKLNVVNLQIKEKELNNAITFVKQNYLDFTKQTDIDINQGFKFVEPFASRDRELNYIVNCISKYLKSECNDDRQKISSMLSNDIAIIIGTDKDKYEQQLNVILKENGVFFLDTSSEIIDQFDIASLKKVIYKKTEFTDTRVKDKTGKLLTRQEKLFAFKKLYKGINISQKSRSFINYPIGQYILEIYKIVNKGMSCEGFKKILYSNWYYNVGLDTVKYDKFIKEFNYIEPYLRKIKDINAWIEELDKIIKIKNDLNNKLEYQYQPLKNISEESLNFLKLQLSDTKIMVDNLSNVFGDINIHLKALNDNFLLDEILNNENIKNEFEIEVIKHLKEIVDGINKSNLITNIDAKYFSDNIRNMLMDYEREKAETSADDLTLNVVNLENMQKFRLTFFCMCEEDKYPRPYRVNFPYTENIIEILTNPIYEIEQRPNFIKTLDYHIRLEKFLFLNVLDITKEQMIITQTEEENGKDLSNSIYIEDIFSMFNEDIKYTKLKDTTIKQDDNYNPIKKVTMPYEDGDKIRLSDLCLYFLCPKIYYYLSNKTFDKEILYSDEWKLNIYIPSLLYYKTLYNLGILGKKEMTIYSVNDDRFISDLQNVFTKTLKEELKLFDFLSSYEKKDIKAKTETQLNYFVERLLGIKDLTFFKFDLTDTETFTLVNEMGKVLNVEIDNCIKIVNAETQYYIAYDISSQMDFLVKSAGGNFYSFEHFDDIFRKLAERNEDDDRIALISYMFFKLNVQLNVSKFRKDGLERIKQISRYIMKQTDDNYIPSSYCKYCKFESICKMKDRGAL